MKGGFMEENIIEIWSQALEILSQEISPVGFTTYVEVMVPRAVDNSTICFLSPSNYHIDICKVPRPNVQHPQYYYSLKCFCNFPYS